MLSVRIIPCLDVHAGRVVKGVNFVNLIDAGDPVEQAKAYEAQGADELVFLDITASSDKRAIMLDVVERTASQCFMPLTVGGGLRTVEDIRKMLNAGADKVSLNTSAVVNPDLVSEASAKFGDISKRQKELEARLAEIAALKKHIINYSKTREIYAEYRKTGYSKKFFEEHRKEITLHKAAKEAFSQIKGPLPKIRELNEEYERVLREKKQTYAEYRQARQEMKDYQTAKYNVEQFLRKEEEERQAETRKRAEQVR